MDQYQAQMLMEFYLYHRMVAASNLALQAGIKNSIAQDLLGHLNKQRWRQILDALALVPIIYYHPLVDK